MPHREHPSAFSSTPHPSSPVEVPRDLSLNDPRDLPLYSRAEAARLLGISGSTMEGYVTQKVRDRGLRVSEPVIRIAEGQHGRLSFNNLVEAYVLNLLRSRHDVSMRAVRRAVTYAEREMGVLRAARQPFTPVFTPRVAFLAPRVTATARPLRFRI